MIFEIEFEILWKVLDTCLCVNILSWICHRLRGALMIELPLQKS